MTPGRLPVLDPDLLQTVVAIAETGSFSAAAASVHRTVSAVSMQVRRIEELLGTVLFHRDSRGVTATPDGVQLIEDARRLLALNHAVVARFRRPDVAGLVRIGAPGDLAELYMADILRRLGASHPGLVVEAVVSDSNDLRARFHDGRLDLGIVSRGAAVGEDLGAEVLYREPLVWAMAEGGVAVGRDPLPLALWEESCSWRRASTEGLNAQGRAWRIAALSAEIVGQRAAVLADLAVTVLPLSALGRGVVEVPARHGLPRLPDDVLVLLARPGAAPAVSAAAEYLRQSFARLRRAA